MSLEQKLEILKLISDLRKSLTTTDRIIEKIKIDHQRYLQRKIK